MPIETELKYPLAEFASVRAKLLALGASFKHRQMEDNELWDYPHLELKKRGCLLRLRTDLFADSKQRSTLTFKQPLSALPVPAATQYCKSRQEDECRLDEPESMRVILSGLGFVKVARYQKLREEWELEKTMQTGQSEHALFCLDYLPFGRFIEIEASDPHTFADMLDLAVNKGTAASYHRLHRDVKGNNASADFVFEEAEWQKLRNGLDIPLP